MDKNTKSVKNVESGEGSEISGGPNWQKNDTKQMTTNKNQDNLNDNEKIDNVDDKNSNAKKAQNMEKNVEDTNKSSEGENLNSSGTQEISKEQTVANENKVELNDNEKIDNTDNKNSNSKNQTENEPELTNKIRKFISHMATLTLTDYRRAYVEFYSRESELNEEEKKRLKAKMQLPDDLSDSKKVAKLIDILLSINKDNAKDYGIDPERLDETKFIVSRILSGDYRKRIVESIDADIANSIIAKDIVIHTMYGGAVQADVYIRKSEFLKEPKNFAKVYDIITNMTEENMYEYVDEFHVHNTINYYKLILSLLCTSCTECKERKKDVLKELSDEDILKVCYCISGKEKDIVFDYLPMDLKIKVFIIYGSRLSLVEICDSATIPECLQTEEVQRKLVEEIKSVNKENVGDYITLDVDELKFVLSYFFTGKAREEIQDSIGDRTKFNKLQIQYIIIKMVKENEQSAGNVSKEYEEFLCENERANEKLLLETIAQINQDNASKYGITSVEDLDRKKFIVSSFFSDEEGRLKVGQSIGEKKLLDMFCKMREVEKMTYFRGLPKSIRTVKTLEQALGNTKFWKDELNEKTGKIEPTTKKKFFLEQAVDYIDPDNNNQNNYAGGYNNRGRFDFAEYMRQMNNLFQNMFVQWQMQQWQQMQQNLQQQWQYNQYQAQQWQRHQQRIRQMQMLNTDDEERELKQLIAQKEQLEIDYVKAASIEDLNNRKAQELNSLSNQKNNLETQCSNLKSLLSEFVSDINDHMLTYMNSYDELPRYVTSKNENAKSLYNFCQKSLEKIGYNEVDSYNLLSKLDGLRNICSSMEQIEHAPRLEFSAKWAYAKNFGLSLFYFFGIDAFVRVISGSKNKKLTGELSSEDENEEYQSWDKLFYIDAFAFLIGVSMIGLFIFMNLTSIAYMFIAIVATEQVIATILKSYRLNHMPPFILKKQAVADYNKAARLLVNDIKDFLSGDKSQKYSDLIRVGTELNDVGNRINQLQNEMHSRRQSQTHPNIDAAQIGAELNNISNRITVLINQINLKRQQQRQLFGTTNNNMFGSRIPDMCNNYGTGFNGFNNGFNNNFYNNNVLGY